MKKLNFLCFLGGLLLTLIGVAKIANFDAARLINQSIAYKFGAYSMLAFIPLLGLIMVITAIKRFKFVTE